ncbi:MAG: class I SAM-dependent methyltransferase [Desulfobacteraceae bacterium]|nr:class I SAM-dependent methyltransferase [Desulfobacteraceae bacterium]
MKESFQSKIERHIKSFPMLNFVARKFYAYPHLNIAAASNFRKLKSHLLEKKTEPRVLMVGGGGSQLGEDISQLGKTILSSAINLELVRGDVVNVVGDGGNLPFGDNYFDLVIAQAVLEHVRYPGIIIQEMERVLSPDGFTYIEVPFLQPFHAYPNDYQRYTIQGLEIQCEIFKRVDSGMACGPSSTVAWILIDYFSLLFSFNNDVLYTVFNILFRWILSPLKYLDLLLNRFDRSTGLASGVYFMGTKSQQKMVK